MEDGGAMNGKLLWTIPSFIIQVWSLIIVYATWFWNERMCDMCCCTYRYAGIANADETSFAAGIALQAYFEGRVITKEDMDKCIKYWKENVSEMEDPDGRKRGVCW